MEAHYTVYLVKMKESTFFLKFIDESPEIFMASNDKCVDFLAAAFSHLHPAFHYLELEDKQVLEQQVLKTALILGIHSSVEGKIQQLTNLTPHELHKFWMRFFYHFELKRLDDKKQNESTGILPSEFTNVFSTLDAANKYFNYDFSTSVNTKSKKLDQSLVNLEIEKWCKRNKMTESIDVDNMTDTNCLKNMSIEEEFSIQELCLKIKNIETKFGGMKRKEDMCDDTDVQALREFNVCVEDITRYGTHLGILESLKNVDFNRNTKCEEQETKLQDLIAIQDNILTAAKLLKREL